jgi:carbon monoxide dehydrogenase subunit G
MRSIILKGSWIINAPQQKIYEIITDFENAPKYFPLVAKSLKIINKQGNNLTIDAVSKTFGIPFHVLMSTQLLPNKGFKSVNTSVLATENESFILEEVSSGTRIIYRNEVQIKNNLLQIFAKMLIGKPTLLFWKYAYIDRLQKLTTYTH